MEVYFIKVFEYWEAFPDLNTDHAGIELYLKDPWKNGILLNTQICPSTDSWKQPEHILCFLFFKCIVS